ncbi:MAG TPA: fluoride efflux transporter CrcB [Solirubrobacteraceae bacterium]|jgi:CrcB protein|nr:fluoride efflux transporter CrcB [Solirubrobacteraceae bacterium]
MSIFPDWAVQISRPTGRARGSDTPGRARSPSPDWRELAAIFLGGAAGAALRVWLGRTFSGGAPSWPWVTFAINVSGSFALAYLATRLQERLPLSTYRRPLLGTGFCGAYTTFSTVQVEILTMIDHHRYPLAAGYASASVAAGYLAIWMGTALVRRTRVIA